MNIPWHDRRQIMSTFDVSPSELGTLTRAVMSCLDMVDALQDEGYRATLLTFQDRLVKLVVAVGGLTTKSEME